MSYSDLQKALQPQTNYDGEILSVVNGVYTVQSKSGLITIPVMTGLSYKAGDTVRLNNNSIVGKVTSLKSLEVYYV